jgi:putative FmdB family regulatory protein
MPLYEYKCAGCGDVFELIQKFSDEPLKTHEKCGGTVERLISAPGLHFKGSGWYITDYARKNGSTEGSTGKSDASKSESGKSDSGKSDSKPADTAAKTSAPASSGSSGTDSK